MKRHHLYLYMALLLVTACATRSSKLTFGQNVVPSDDLEINSKLRLGFKGQKWYFVPYDEEHNHYQVEKAKECFMNDYGPDHFSEGLARFVENSKIGLLNEDGQVVVPPVYDYISPIENSMAVVCIGCLRHEDTTEKGKGLWGVIDYKGKVIVPVLYAEIDFDPWAQKVNVRMSAPLRGKKQNKKQGRKKGKMITIKRDISE